MRPSIRASRSNSKVVAAAMDAQHAVVHPYTVVVDVVHRRQRTAEMHPPLSVADTVRPHWKSPRTTVDVLGRIVVDRMDCTVVDGVFVADIRHRNLPTTIDGAHYGMDSNQAAEVDSRISVDDERPAN